ncbi:MAG: tetratricopeptide repeat protein, partial [Gammaproteobacteria bacterium]
WLALHQGHPAEADTAYGKAIKIAGTSRLVIDYAQAKWETNDWKGSMAVLDDWLKKHPEDVGVRFRLGTEQMVLHHNDQALRVFRRVVHYAPDHAAALNNLAWLLRDKEPAKALAYAEKAQNLAPNDPTVMDTLGSVLLEQGQTEKALRLFQQASASVPQDRTFKYHLAKALAKSGKTDEAKAMLQKLLADKKPFYEIWGARALLRQLGG